MRDLLLKSRLDSNHKLYGVERAGSSRHPWLGARGCGQTLLHGAGLARLGPSHSRGVLKYEVESWESESELWRVGEERAVVIVDNPRLASFVPVLGGVVPDYREDWQAALLQQTSSLEACHRNSRGP